MKKVLSIIVAMIMVLSVIPLSAAATPTITVSSASAEKGATVSLNVSISNNPGINTFSLGFDYDTSRLSLTNVAKSEGLPGQFQYSRKAVWLNSSDTTYNGVILVLTFKVLDNAPSGDASVAVTYSTGDISNYNEDDVDFTLVSGKVSIGGGSVAQGTITVSSVSSAAPSSEVNVNVSISGNPGINTFSLGFEYDTSRLNLINVEKASALPGQFQYSRKAVWLNSSDTTYNGTILILTFKVLDNAPDGAANVSVTYSEGDISNYNEDNVNFAVVPGTVTIKSGDVPPQPQTDALISVANVTGRAGNEVNVSISVANNPGIAGMALTVNYDRALTLVSVSDGGILGSSLHTSNYSLNPYYLSWANDTATENFTANGVIATLTFKIAENAAEGTYPVSVSYNNSNFDIFNVNAETVEFKTAAGGVTIKSFIVGDVNDDGNVNAQDRLILSRYLAKWDGYAAQIISMDAADINGDGSVNAQDRLILSRYLAKWDGYESYFAG